MNKIDELIQQYCPEGVEYVKLGDCCNILDSQRKPVAKGARSNGIYPYYGANGIQDYVSDYIFDGTYVLVGEDGSVITKNGNPVINWATGKIWVNNHAHILGENDKAILRYLFFILQTLDITPLIHGNIPKLTKGDLKDLEIPLPPLSVQEAIVNILDRFTVYAAELQAELQARQQQYNYYRDTLLSFEGREDVEWKKLGEVADLGTGSHNTQDGLSEGKYPFYTRGSEILYLNNYDYDETAIITAGDGAGVGKVFHFVQGKYALHQRAYRIVPNEKIVLARFVYYYIGATFYNYIMKSSVSSSVVSIRKPMMVDYPIPVPSIEEQEKVISILDRFDTLVNDLSQGLPAEIEARQQQYEYYRDQLLTFKRKEA